MLITDACEVVLSSGTIQFNNNGGAGILVFTSSSLQISRSGPTVITNGNRTDGISLAQKAQFLVPGGTLTASQNGQNGMRVAVDSLFSTGGATVNLSENTGSGIDVLIGSQVQKILPGELIIQNNQASGIAVDFGSLVTLLGGTTITDNGPADARSDLGLSFGTMATVAGENTIGAIICDGTVWSRTPALRIGEHADAGDYYETPPV